MGKKLQEGELFMF